MSINQLAKQIDEEIIYPDSDGQPMADNTKQFDWINHIVINLQTQYLHDPKVFIAGDLLWYPIEGDNKTRRAPDAMVAFRRPKGHRGSYKQWLENDIAPQVVFEIRSPGNKDSEMEEKFQFYKDYQVQEYYLYAQDTGQLKGWIRGGGQLRPIVSMNGWQSPRLGIRFELIDKELSLYRPNGKPFTRHHEEVERADAEARARQAEKQRADAEAKARLAEKQRADAEAKARLAEKRRADAEAKARQAEKQRAETAEAQLARLQSLLAQKGISLDETLVSGQAQS
jgi:Uma2 family endonuclease